MQFCFPNNKGNSYKLFYTKNTQIFTFLWFGYKNFFVRFTLILKTKKMSTYNDGCVLQNKPCNNFPLSCSNILAPSLLSRYNWFYHTLPQEHCNNRVMYWPRGRVWGGSSSLNAMVYVRGHAADYDRWARAEGARGWSYADCLPYFRRAQSHALGADAYRGGDGPLHVSRGNSGNPLHEAWLAAGVQAGYPLTEDMNGYQQEGVGRMDATIHKVLHG